MVKKEMKKIISIGIICLFLFTCFLSASAIKTEENGGENTPKEYKLYQNYPNPFNSVTVINYSLPNVSNVKVTIYNTLGEIVKTIIYNENVSPGNYNHQWDGTDNYGNIVTSGVYIYTIQTRKFTDTKKMIVVR